MAENNNTVHKDTRILKTNGARNSPGIECISTFELAVGEAERRQRDLQSHSKFSIPKK